MAPTTRLANQALAGLEGRRWDEALLKEVNNRFVAEFTLPADVPGGMSRYRTALVLSFFFKFFIHVAEQLKASFRLTTAAVA